jgi:OOP family OmpA-OmpF porin
MFKKIASAAALFIASTAAFAGQPNTFYAGADVGKTRFDEWSGRETSYGVFGGYNFHPNVAVEAGYRRLGEEKSGGYKVSADQLALSVVGTVPVGESFSVYGRLGVNRLEGKVRYNGMSISDDTTKALLGVGVAYAFTPKISGRLEFQKAGNDTRNLSAGVSYQF